MSEKEDEPGLLASIAMDFGLMDKTTGYEQARADELAARAAATPHSSKDKEFLQNRAEAAAADAATAANADKDAKGTTVPKKFEEQCFVIDAIEEFSKANRGTEYKNFITLDGTKDDAALLVSKINSRFGENENGLKQFMNITPAQYSMLIPKIRLFVQKRQDEKDKFGMIQELKFKDFTNKSSIEDIMKSAQGRGDDAGLVSFSYEFDGRDPGSVTNMIRGDIRLLFTDFDTLVKPIRGITGEEEQHFAPTTPIDFQYLEPRFLDLIVRQPTRKKIEGLSLPYLIKVHAEIGWQEPADATEEGVFPKELKQYIKDGYLNEYLVLDIMQHEMDFKEDGRIELAMEYRADTENVLFKRTDILSLGKEIEEAAKEKEAKEKAKLEVRKRIQEEIAGKKHKAGRSGELTVTEGGKKVGSFDVDDDMKEVAQFVSTQQTKMEYLIEMQKIARYRKLLDTLQQSKKIKFIDLNPNDVKQWIAELHTANLYPDDPQTTNSRIQAATVMRNSGVLTTEKVPGRARVRSVLKSQTATESVSLSAAKEQLDKMAEAEKDRLEAAQDGDSVSSRSKPRSSLEYDKEKADAAPGSDKHRVHFMYLGDVMDVACGVLYDLPPHLGNTRIVAGPVQYVSQKDKKMKNINLADVPISLEALSDWIYRNIIAKGLSSMSLGNFLSSLITDLAYQAMGQKSCFGSIKEYPSLMMSPISLNLSGPAAGQLTEPIARANGIYPRISVNDFAGKAKNNLASRGDLRGRKIITTATYIFLNGVVREENNFNYGANSFNVEFHRNGVYNLGIGRDRGIVKNIKFSRSDSPYEEEMRVEQRRSEQGFTLGEFRQVYNATVKLVGNTLFRNGQYVRLDPSTMGLEQRTAIQLGLGGMYVITKVEGELSRAGYATTLTCKYNSTGESKKKN